MNEPGITSFWHPSLSMLLAFVPALATAQPVQPDASAHTHSHIKYSGNNWTCNLGYRRQGELCITEKK